MPIRSLYNARSPGFFGAREARLAAATSSAIHAIGWDFTTAGTIATPTIASGTLRSQMRRSRFVASVTISVGLRTTDPVCWRAADSGSAGRGGFCLSVRFCIETGVGTRAFVGVAAQSAPVTNAQPSSATNVFGIGFDGGGTSWSVIRSDGVGPATTTTISGATVNADVWELTILCAPGAATMRLNLTNMTSGAVLVRDVEYATNLPDGNVVLYVHAHAYAVSSTHAIEIMGATLEVPDGAAFVDQPVGREGVYDVRDFGAHGDGASDDLPAFKSALAAMGTDVTGPGRQGTLLVPPGTYWLTGNLELNRAILLKGAGAGGRQTGEGASRLLFDPLRGVRIHGLENDPAGVGDATYAAIEDLEIVGSDSLPFATFWSANTPFAVGQAILPLQSRATKDGSSFEYYYECVRAGTTGTTEPDWPGTAAPGIVPVQSITPSFGPRVGSTAYLPRQVVRASNRWDVLFVCTTKGTSAAGGDPLGFATAVPGTQITEGPSGPPLEWTTFSSSGHLVAENGTLASPGANTIIWACRVSSGIYAQTRFSARRVTISNYLNAAISVQAAGQVRVGGVDQVIQPGNANGSSLYDLNVSNCGGGVMTRGHDVNAGIVSAARIRTWPNDDRTFGIADKAQGGNRFLSCSIDECAGPPLDQRSDSSTGTFLGCFASSSCGKSIIGTTNGYDVFGCNLASGVTLLQTSSVLGALDQNDWREVWKNDGTTSAKLYASPYIMSANAPTETFLAVGYNFTGIGMAGWWTWFVGSSTASSLAWSGGNAAEGAGNLWAYNGLFVGDPFSILSSDTVKPDLGLGTWRQGDIVINAGAAPGDPSYWQCVVAGTPGTWADGPLLP